MYKNTIYADTVYTGGAIYTLDEQQPWAECVAICDGKFMYVGTDLGGQAYIGEQTTVIDLKGKMAMPGLHDMHIHGVEGAIAELYHCKIALDATIDEIMLAVEEFADNRPHERWITGGLWSMHLVPHIDKQLLDAVCPDRPVFLWDASHHNGWVNSKALELGGITATTPNPAGGEIVRDAHGNATGLLLETATSSLVELIPERSDAEYEQAVMWLADMLNRLGVTSIKEAAVNRPMMRAYKAVNDAGKLNLRVGCHFLWITPFVYDAADLESLLNDRHQYAGERVKVNFAKLFLDGVPAARTACMLDPYTGDDPATHDPYGLLLVDREYLNEALITLDGAGMLVKMHATGDASLRAGLNAIAAARESNGDSGLAHEIAHPQNVHPDDLPRFAELGAVPDLCPILWHPSLNKEQSVIPAVGEERVQRSWPIASYHRSGARMIAGTDWPAMVPSANNWPGIQTMITRADPTGLVAGMLGENEAIDLATALRIYTINGAHAACHADVCGSIEVGKYADMIVLDRNLFETPSEQLGTTQVLQTVLEGTIIWDVLKEL